MRRYCEEISLAVITDVKSYSVDFISRLIDLASQLKYNDDHFQLCEGELSDMSDPEWLRNLQNALYNLQFEMVTAAQNEEVTLNTTQDQERTQVVTSVDDNTNNMAGSGHYVPTQDNYASLGTNNSFMPYDPSSYSHQQEVGTQSDVINYTA